MTDSGNHLLDLLPPDELDLLRPHFEHVTLDLHTRLIAPDEPIPWCYFPLTMLASLVTVLDDGTTIESGSVGREGMVGVPVLLNAETTPMQTVVQIGGQTIRIRSAVVKEVFERRQRLYDVLNRYIHTLFVVASQSAACNRRHQVEARLARWLLMSSDGVGSDELAITHEYLATMLGVRRPGVTEAAVKLQESGLIQYRRGGVQILDRQGLTDAACECYGMVKGEYERLLA